MTNGTALDEQIRYEVDGAIGRITICRPEVGNSLTTAMRDRLTEVFKAASAALSTRAIILTGAGTRHFCTGAGLGGPQPTPAARPEGAPERTAGEVAWVIKQGWQQLIASILDCDKPVIAAVNGTAAGGGAQLVLACDLVLMADHARLIEVFVRRGIIPDAGGAYLLPRIVGLPRAKELMFFGDDLSAPDAERFGIANRVVQADELEKLANEWASRLAEGPTKAIASTKGLLNRSFESSRHAAFEDEALAQDLISRTDDMQEGIRAFAERRDPRFQGW